MSTFASPARGTNAGGSRAIPRGGHARLGGRLDRFVQRIDSRNAPVHEDGLTFVSVEGQHPRKAVIDRRDFERITSRRSGGPHLTRSRWFLDDAGMLRAYSGHEFPNMTHGVLVAAAVLGVQEGACIDMPADPFDVRSSSLRRVS
ncbi:hypothetical protein [Pseudorhodoferax sp.]|uniref:hypothetical protein n=1 Tax=Pseudorhodoferax sp. TaxID=1993553 RepID=UPI002DD6A909|nr:hypothetical protein [Pseudorhodoferax sp.]